MKIDKLLALVVFLGFLLIGLIGLSNYGPNWDEPVHFGRGQAILHYFFTGSKDYQDLSTDFGLRQSFYQSDAYTYAYFEKDFSEKTGTGELIIGGGHPPLSDVLAAFFNLIFFQKLKLLGDIESFHFYNLFLASILVAAVFYFTAKIYGRLAGLIAALSLAIYPLFLGESRFNIKDVPETVFYSLTILFFYQAVAANKSRWLWLSALFFSFGLGTKLNIVFVPFLILPWLFLFLLPEIKRKGVVALVKKRARAILTLASYPILGILIFFASWPILWPSPLERLFDVVWYYKKIGISPSFDSRFLTYFNFNTYAFQWILYTTPLVILFFTSLGIAYSLRYGFKEKCRPSLLIFFWFLVPVLRVTMPGTGIYGGVRQIMEYIPAMAILAGIGAKQIVRLSDCYIAILLKKARLPSNLKEKKLLITHYSLLITSFLSFLPLALKLISIHPNESIFFNSLIGGLKGAKEKDLPGWGNSLGSTYRQGVRWLNQNAEPKAKLALVYELKSNIAQIDLRPDIFYDNHVRSAIKKEGEYVIGVTHQGTAENSYHRKYLERFLYPVYELKVDEVAVLKIWKNDALHTKPEYLKEEEIVRDFSLEKGEGFLLVDLKKALKITKLEINYPYSHCRLPANGNFEVSLDGHLWERLPDNLQLFNLASWFTPLPEKGKLQFLFAADGAQFIKLIINDKNSCLLTKPVNLTVWKI